MPPDSTLHFKKREKKKDEFFFRCKKNCLKKFSEKHRQLRVFAPNFLLSLRLTWRKITANWPPTHRQLH
jgi:hypothetical protein